jgi:hypothetical protein
MGGTSRTKGKVGEREAARLLRAHGFVAARRGQQFAGGIESPDVVGLDGFHIEVKRCERGSLHEWLGQAIAEGGARDMPLVLHRRNNGGWVGIMRADDLLALIRQAKRGARKNADAILPAPGKARRAAPTRLSRAKAGGDGAAGGVAD